MEAKTQSLNFMEISACLFLSAVFTFPRSYLLLKLILLVVLLLVHAPMLAKERPILVHFRLLVFYVSIAGIGLIWSLVGLINAGALAGIIDNLRLYVAWSAAFVVIYSLLLRGNAFLVFHKSIVIAGILISGLNLFALYNYVGQLGVVPLAAIKELNMYIGIYEGYIQFTSHNIGSLFFIAAYLMTVQFRKDLSHLNGNWPKIALYMCLVLVLLSGRRALWIAVALVPFLIMGLAVLTNGLNQLRGRKSLLLICLMGVIPMAVVLDFILNGDFASNSSLLHLQEAFSSADERTIQKSYLIDGFSNYPIFGSGFGAYAGYLRSEQMPWLYELTYHQMLFNFGIVGFALFSILMAVYFCYALAFIAQCNPNSGLAFSMLVAIITFAIGSYSNPYFGSFDFLMFLGVMPLIAASYNATANNRSRSEQVPNDMLFRADN